MRVRSALEQEVAALRRRLESREDESSRIQQQQGEEREASRLAQEREVAELRQRLLAREEENVQAHRRLALAEEESANRAAADREGELEAEVGVGGGGARWRRELVRRIPFFA